MATTILLWDTRFPDARPRRLTVDDRIAGYAVRAGCATPVDPALAGTLSAGAAVSGASPVLAILQHGLATQTVSPVWLPIEVAVYAASLGLASGFAGAVGAAPAPATAPLAPAISVTAGNASNVVSIADGSDGGAAITSRQLYRSTSSGFTPGGGNLIGSVTFPYTDSGLTNATPYYYVAKTTNSVGQSPASPQQAGTPSASSFFTRDSIQYFDGSSTYSGASNGDTVDALGQPVLSEYLDMTIQKWIGDHTNPVGKDNAPILRDNTSGTAAPGSVSSFEVVNKLYQDIDAGNLVNGMFAWYQLGGNPTLHTHVSQDLSMHLAAVTCATKLDTMTLKGAIHTTALAKGSYGKAIQQWRIQHRQEKYHRARDSHTSGNIMLNHGDRDWVGVNPTITRTARTIKEQQQWGQVSQLTGSGHHNGQGYATLGAFMQQAYESFIGAQVYIPANIYYAKNIASGGLISKLAYFGVLTGCTFAVDDSRFQVVVVGTDIQLKLTGAAPPDAMIKLNITISKAGLPDRVRVIHVGVSSRTGTAPALVRIKNRALIFRDADHSAVLPTTRKFCAVIQLAFQEDDGLGAFGVAAGGSDTRSQVIWSFKNQQGDSNFDPNNSSYIRAGDGNINNRLAWLERTTTGQILFYVLDASGDRTAVKAINVTTTDVWRRSHGMRSLFINYDADNPSNCFLYLSESTNSSNTYAGAETAITPLGEGSLDFSRYNFVDSADQFCLLNSIHDESDTAYCEVIRGHIWMATGANIDFRDPTERAKFFNPATQMPVDLSSATGVVNGITPRVCMYHDAAESFISGTDLSNAHDSEFGGNIVANAGTANWFSGLVFGNPGDTRTVTSAPVVASLSGTPTAGRVGDPYDWTPTTSGGAGTRLYSFTQTSGQAAAGTLAGSGLTFVTATGRIYAAGGAITGSAGAVSGKISVTDDAGTCDVPLNVTVTIAAAITALLNDTFDGTDGALLAGRAATPSGQTWFRHPALTAGTAQVLGNKIAHVANVVDCFINNEATLSADLRASGYIVTGSSLNSRVFYIVVRYQSDGSGYVIGLNNTALKANKMSAAGALVSTNMNTMFTSSAPALALNTAYRVDLEIRGNDIRLSINGSLYGGWTDATGSPIAAAGKVGIYMTGSTPDTSTTGILLDQFTATNLTAISTTALVVGFTAANGTTLGDYVSSSGAKMFRHPAYGGGIGAKIYNGGLAKAGTLTEVYIADYVSPSPDTAYTATFVNQTIISGQTYAVVVRADEFLQTMIYAGIIGSQLRLFKISGGTQTALQSITSPIVPTAGVPIVIRVVPTGNNYKVYLNGSSTASLDFTDDGTTFGPLVTGPGHPGIFMGGGASSATDGILVDGLVQG